LRMSPRSVLRACTGVGAQSYIQYQRL
jgi:hypothetical protein